MRTTGWLSSTLGTSVVYISYGSVPRTFKGHCKNIKTTKNLKHLQAKIYSVLVID